MLKESLFAMTVLLCPWAMKSSEAVKRVSENLSWLFVFNHTSAKLGVQLETIGRNLLTGREVKDFVELEPSGIAIIQSPAQ